MNEKIAANTFKPPAFDFTFKYFIEGDIRSGKTSCITRFIDGYFNQNIPTTIGIDLKVIYETVEGHKVKLQLV